MISGKCHCGNVSLQVPEPPDSLTSCNCSICNRVGALWAYYPIVAVKIYCEREETSGYSWGDKTIVFHHCSGCGCITHYLPHQNSGRDSMAVNFRMMDLSLIEPIPVRKFDGADTWSVIDD